MKNSYTCLLLTAILTVTESQFERLFRKNINSIMSGLPAFENNVPEGFQALRGQFDEYKAEFNKKYNPEEDKIRLEIFARNHQLMETFNNATYSFIMRASQYADLAVEEFNRLVNGLFVDRAKSRGIRFVHKAVNIPRNIDLRDEGVITPVRSQGRCASCYAFAATAALESHLLKKTGKRQTLSPQNIMDCTKSKPYANLGCTGGYVDPCFDFIKTKGINEETIYPYQAKVGNQCMFQENKSVGYVNDYVLLDEGDEKGLEMAIATKGPVTAGIDAHAKSFQFYGGGIYYEPKCRSTIDALNHAVLVIGYTPEYWIIKNSYGLEWGENGFGKISRNITNHCGIASYAVYPIV